MGEFIAGIQQRLSEAEAALADALEGEDPYAIDLAQAELDDLRRIAADHGLTAA